MCPSAAVRLLALAAFSPALAQTAGQTSGQTAGQPAGHTAGQATGHSGTAPAFGRSEHRWDVHDMARPLPPRAEPAGPVTTPPPTDALVLFDGSDLAAWRHDDGSPAKWRILDDGSFEVARGTGTLSTRAPFADVQLHIEWMCPESEAAREGQNRGNSGLFLMSLYEVQILESVGGVTYADGMAASIYGQRPPRVNAGSGLGRWNSYDVIFRAPRFDGERLLRPATLTVLHNGIVVHDSVALEGPTKHRERTSYTPHAAELPIQLQDHGEPVRFRNVWVRPLDPESTSDPLGPGGAWTELFTAGEMGRDHTIVMQDGSDGARALSTEDGEVRILYGWERPDAPNGYIITQESYSSYDITLEHRYGERRFAPRADQVRNSGLLLHVRDASEVWPPSFEYQLMQGSVGDAWAIKGVKALDAFRGGVLNQASSTGYANAKRAADHEDEQGWTRSFVQVRGDRMWFWVNGRLVNEFRDVQTPDAQPLDSGRIALQIEGAEITIRDVRIRPIGG